MPVVFAGEKYFTVESRSGCVLSARHMTPALAKPAGGASAGPGTAGRGQRPSPARQWRPPSWPAPPSWCGSTSPRAGGRLAGPTHTTGSWWANPVPGWGTLAHCHELSGSVRRCCGEVLTCPPPHVSLTHITHKHTHAHAHAHTYRERGGGERDMPGPGVGMWQRCRCVGGPGVGTPLGSLTTHRAMPINLCHYRAALAANMPKLSCGPFLSPVHE